MFVILFVALSQPAKWSLPTPRHLWGPAPVSGDIIAVDFKMLVFWQWKPQGEFILESVAIVRSPIIMGYSNLGWLWLHVNCNSKQFSKAF